MLSDHAFINVCGGSGGAGSVSFRREKHVPSGGPDGGNGGAGGDVVIVATRQFRDLAYFRHKVHFKGQRGGHGAGQKRHGKAGEPTIIEVPVGTEVRDADGVLLADLITEGQRVVVARGAEGGRGNTCFVSSTRRVPRFAEKGLPGEERWLDLQLKLLADVGLVGLPNAGKSSLLAALTRARPKVASYPFTTLEPNLGTLTLGERVVVLADIPGLIEGASSGTGLGDRFLAHIERTVVLVFVVDGSLGADAALAAVEHGARRARRLQRRARRAPRPDRRQQGRPARRRRGRRGRRRARSRRSSHGRRRGRRLGGRAAAVSTTCCASSTAAVERSARAARGRAPSPSRSCCCPPRTASATTRCAATVMPGASRVARSSAWWPRPSSATRKRCATCRT